MTLSLTFANIFYKWVNFWYFSFFSRVSQLFQFFINFDPKFGIFQICGIFHEKFSDFLNYRTFICFLVSLNIGKKCKTAIFFVLKIENVYNFTLFVHAVKKLIAKFWYYLPSFIVKFGSLSFNLTISAKTCL